MRVLLAAIGMVAMLAACETPTVQTSSGSDYLAKYPTGISAASTGAAVAGGSATIAGANKVLTMDDVVRKAADVEPVLRLPAHLGLARIEKGRITEIPESELALWQDLAKQHPKLGKVSLVDPLIAEITAQSFSLRNTYGTAGAIAKLRVGAARQHMDAILIYEVGVSTKKETTALAFMDLTIIGGAVLPTRSIKTKGMANALLVGVLNGYPYGTAQVQKKFRKLSSAWGSDYYRGILSEDTTRDLITDLIPQVDTMIKELKPALAEVQASAS